MTPSNHETHPSGIPCWVIEAVQDKIDAADIGFARHGRYVIEVARETEPCSDCGVEVWRATIDCDTWDHWDREVDPTLQREPITWKEFNIELEY